MHVPSTINNSCAKSSRRYLKCYNSLILKLLTSDGYKCNFAYKKRGTWSTCPGYVGRPRIRQRLGPTPWWSTPRLSWRQLSVRVRIIGPSAPFCLVPTTNMGWIRVGRTRESTTCGSDKFRRENPHGCADRTGRRGPKRIRYKIRVGKENIYFFFWRGGSDVGRRYLCCEGRRSSWMYFCTRHGLMMQKMI